MQAIHECCVKHNIVCNVVGVPKSIDNDILLIDSCFGFETAVTEAQRALMAAKVEARSAYRGLGLVNVMGRQSGFIAMNASMASGVVDICLIPEMLFNMEKLFEHVAKVLDDQGHCVVCVAEGAGQVRTSLRISMILMSQQFCHVSAPLVFHVSSHVCLPLHRVIAKSWTLLHVLLG